MRSNLSLYIIQLTIISLLFSCQLYNYDDKDVFVIKGEIKLNDEWQNKIYLSKMNSIGAFFTASPGYIVDTSVIKDDGAFEFIIDSLPDEQTFYRLNLAKKGAPGASIILGNKDDNFIFLLSNKGSEITITGDANKLTQSYIVEGSSENQLIKKLTELREPVYKVTENHESILLEAQDNPNLDADSLRKTLMSGFESSLIENNISIKKFIDSTQSPLVAILATKYFDYDDDLYDDLEYFELLNERFQKELPNSKYVEQFNRRIIEFKTVLPIGSKAPDIELYDTVGNSISLSHVLKKNKIVLIDFWASWCSPCREENKQTVLPLYRKYHEKGFEVFGVSFDTDKQKWINAIGADGILWTQVSDLKGMAKSPVASNYQIKSVPTTYLLDGQGNIIAKGLRGFLLEDFIDEFIKKN